MKSDRQATLANASPAPTATAAAVRIGVLSNRLSTRNRGGAEAVRAILSAHPGIAHVEIDDWNAMPDALGKLISLGVDAIAVNGGDGTVIGILTELRRRKLAPSPDLIALPSGNTNLIAGDVGIAEPPERMLRRVLEAAASGAALCRQERRAIRVVQEGDPDQYGFFIGAVALVRAIQIAHRTLYPIGVKHGLGHSAAMGIGVLRVLLGGAGGKGLLSGVPAEVAFDDEPMRGGDYTLIMATTLQRMIFGARPFWGTEAAPIRTTLVHAPADRPLRSLLPLLRGRPTERMRRHGYDSRNAFRLRIALDGPVAVDGEIRQSRADRPLELTDGGAVAFLGVRP